MNIISKTYKDIEILFSNSIDENIYLNVTNITKSLNKDLSNWRRSSQTKEYIKALLSSVNSTELTEDKLFRVILGKGKAQGTWIHKKLIIAFARWLSPDFAVWCDSVIEEFLNL